MVDALPLSGTETASAVAWFTQRRCCLLEPVRSGGDGCSQHAKPRAGPVGSIGSVKSTGPVVSAPASVCARKGDVAEATSSARTGCTRDRHCHACDGARRRSRSDHRSLKSARRERVKRCRISRRCRWNRAGFRQRHPAEAPQHRQGGVSNGSGFNSRPLSRPGFELDLASETGTLGFDFNLALYRSRNTLTR
jgi:hypothetical protein